MITTMIVDRSFGIGWTVCSVYSSTPGRVKDIYITFYKWKFQWLR